MVNRTKTIKSCGIRTKSKCYGCEVDCSKAKHIEKEKNYGLQTNFLQECSDYVSTERDTNRRVD